jgi:hypothetical protein
MELRGFVRLYSGGGYFWILGQPRPEVMRRYFKCAHPR